jgi:hypothetical protein
MIQSERLQAPREHLGILAEPGADAIHAALAQDVARALAPVSLAGRSASEWRRDLRRRLGLRGPLVVTGHQAEFFHAGVFAKTIAAHNLAAQAGGSPVFLSVDSDLPKTLQVTVPEITSNGLRPVNLAIPGCDPQRPMESQPAAPRREWVGFFVRMAALHEHGGASLVRPFADAWLAGGAPQIEFCPAILRGSAAIEQALDLPGVHAVRVSALCAMPEFRAFAAHLIQHAPRLAAAYNEAQARYRARHRVQSATRPVPPLATAGDQTEVPLWVSQPDGPRQRLQVARVGERFELYAGSERIAELSMAELGDPPALAQPWSFERAGWRLRPRALALSTFARLLLADVFIHGIGGARYDEITDDYAREFFGVELAPLCCVSATLHLPLPHSGVRLEEVRGARRASRDVRFNPQRYVRSAPPELLEERNALVARSDELRARRLADRPVRRSTFDGIHRVNERLLAQDPWRAAELEQRAQDLAERYALDRIALHREYFVALHLRATLAELVARLRQALTLSPDAPARAARR